MGKGEELPGSTLSIVSLPSILLSSQPYRATFPTEGRHQALSGRLRTGRHRDLKASRPCLERRQRHHSLVGLQHELEVVKFTGDYWVDPDG